MSQKQEDENPAEETGEEKQEKEGILPERAEEAKLKAKYPSLGQKPGGSDFLMKRLQKGQKYFDSGDYNMAKAKMKNKQLPSAGPDKNLVTGDHIPTPQDLPQRKSSLVTSKLAGFRLPAPGPLRMTSGLAAVSGALRSVRLLASAFGLLRLDRKRLVRKEWREQDPGLPPQTP
ncbi:alpha-endosulfine isoform X2 [Fukomys damarensis]|uniref:alpha-endosulfine isoform X2 n=1 Tax=Fukomys damarensis TaxID=885580 RepID=UPI001455B2AB|nr:alpha-endosulfine isoform X2 [Fukomys damarensis]